MKRVLCCLIVLLIASCTKEEKSKVPYARVYFVVDLQFKDKELSSPYAFKTFTTPRNAGEYVGFSGLLVMHGQDGYYAYDLCCPHDAKKNIQIIPDGLTAVCGHCESEYDINYGGGNCLSGPSKHSLVRYPVTRNGQELIIQY